MSRVSAVQNPDTGEVTLENGLVRIRFHRGVPRFGLFPLGYTGYTLELLKDGAATPVARAPYFTAYSYRSGWGRDWLHYVVPKTVEISQEAGRVRAVFTETHHDLDRVAWHFEFTFEVEEDLPVVHAAYTVRVDDAREVLLFQGPRLHVGDGSFGARKDEALFPGLEYLQSEERSSAMTALAPDARLHFAPHPARITIPLMAVVCDGMAAGMLWDPLQTYGENAAGPSAVFASPNWIEDEPNHLVGLFLPGIPDYVPENGLRAHKPFDLSAGASLRVEADLFALPAQHTTDAVDLWLRLRGGLPAPVDPPQPHRPYLNELVRTLVDDIWNEEAAGWPWEYGGAPSPHMSVATALAKALPWVDDPALADRARAQIADIAPTSAYLPLAIRGGDLARALEVQRAHAEALMDAQHEDGSWGYVPTEIGEGGLAGLMGPPEPGAIAPEGTRTQGITAQKAADLLGYALLTGDEGALERGLLALEDMNRYTVPYVYENNECPPSPSLHGAYAGLRACLAAYRITGDEAHLDQAVYWAKTGLPFVYLWSYGPRTVERGQVHTAERIFVPGDRLYRETLRDPMLYGALYGYGSSQFMHHWYGLLVHWIGLKYAEDLAALAPYDHGEWKRLADGLVISGMWQTFDQPPFAGYFPDAFSVERWVPSGPAFSPAALIHTLLNVHYGVRDTETVIVRDGGRRHHITSSRAVEAAEIADGTLRFALDDPACAYLQVVVSGLSPESVVRVDGEPVEGRDQLNEDVEGHMRTPSGLTLIKIRRTGTPRKVEIAL